MKRTMLTVALALVVAALGTVAVWAQETTLCRAAVYNGPGASPTCANASLEILAAAPNFEAKFISAEEIQTGKLRDFDVVLFPGGSGNGESRAIGDAGWRELRAFLNDGGGYLGTSSALR